jgi:hypothetical protein
MQKARYGWAIALVALLVGLPGCEDINPGLVVGVRPDPTGEYDAQRLFGEDLPAAFEELDEIWVYESAGLDILSDGTYDLEVAASLAVPDTLYVGLLLGSGTWDRSPLSNSILTIDVPVVDFIADGDTILTGRFELQTALAIDPEGLVSVGGAPDDVWVKR